MVNFLRGLASTVSILVVSGCAQALGPEASLVLGEWRWVSSCCSIAGAGVTPETEGYEYVLRFTSAGVVEAMRDGSLLHATGFDISRTSPDDTPSDELVRMEYDSPVPHGPSVPPAGVHLVFQLPGDTLILRNPHCADCFGDWRFVKR